MPAFVGLIARVPISKRHDRRLSALSKDGHRAAQIVTSIRAMFKKDTGAKSPVAMNELVCDVVSTSLGELKSRHVSLSLQLLDTLPQVRADRVQFQQVLLNLLTNATDSMESVVDRPHTLCVRSENLENCILISVQDSGTGIPPEHAERLFDAFFTTKSNGIGLGYLSLYSRVPWRSAIGFSSPSARRSIPNHPTYRRTG
jgi:C4-dicarboxylate-specific signal transduction histidine kinase